MGLDGLYQINFTIQPWITLLPNWATVTLANYEIDLRLIVRVVLLFVHVRSVWFYIILCSSMYVVSDFQRVVRYMARLLARIEGSHPVFVCLQP